MKLMKHIIYVDIDDNKKLMINSLNGLMGEARSILADILLIAMTIIFVLLCA